MGCAGRAKIKRRRRERERKGETEGERGKTDDRRRWK